MKLSLLSPGGMPMDAMVFADGDAFMEEMGQSRQMDAIYYPGIHEYNGSRSLQVVIREWRFS